MLLNDYRRALQQTLRNEIPTPDKKGRHDNGHETKRYLNPDIQAKNLWERAARDEGLTFNIDVA